MTTDIPSAVSPADLLAHRAWVRALARRLVRSESDADDLAQDALVTALERPPQSREALRPWFRRVLVNRARDRHRRAERRAAREQHAPTPRATPSPAELAATADAHRLVLDAVLDLDEAARDLVLLRYFEGLSPGEIAARRGIPASTVRTRLLRARERLRGRLDDRHDGDRRQWIAALAPLLGAGDGSGQPVTAGATTSPAGLLLGAAVVGLLVVAIAIWQQADDGAAAVATATPQTTAAADGGADGSSRAPRDRSRPARERVTPSTTAAPATTAPVEPAVAPVKSDSTQVVLRVRVTADERPVAGAVVRLFTLPEPQGSNPSLADGAKWPGETRWREIELTRTDGTGLAAVSGPAGVVVHLRAESGDLVALHPAFRVPDAETGLTADLELEPSITLRGRVVDLSEKPVPGAAFVARIDLADEEQLTRLAVTDADGRFELRHVPAAAVDDIITYEVLAAGFVDGWGAVNQDTDLAQPIVVRLQGAAVVTGRCIDEAGEAVTGVYVAWNDQRGVDTDAEGRFRLGGLPRERPVLEFRPEEHVPVSRELPLLDGPSYDLGDVVLGSGVTARGLVLDAAGRPVPGAHVVVYAGDSLVRQGETGKDGRFAFGGVPETELLVEASAPSENGEWASPLEGATEGVRATDGDIVVRLSAALSVVVELRLASDNSVVKVMGIDIEVESLAELGPKTGNSYYGGEMSSVRGTVEKPGRYRVTVSAMGYADWTVDEVEITERGETRVIARLSPAE